MDRPTRDRRTTGGGSTAARRSPAYLVLLMALALVAAACGGDDSDETPTGSGSADTNATPDDETAGGLQGDPITIGVIEDRSGGASFYSAQAVNMLKLATDRVNEGKYLDAESALPNTDAGIMGRPVELIFEDDQGDPNLTVVRTRGLVERGADLIFFSSGSSSTVQGRVVCQEEKIFCMAPNNVSGAILKPPNTDYIFTIAPPGGDTVKVFIDIFNRQGFKSVAYNSDDTATAQALKDSYKDSFEAAGFATAADEVVSTGSTDITAQVVRMQNANPDVIFDMSQTATEGGLFFRTSKRLAPDIPRFGTNSVTSQPEMWEIAGDDGMEGLLVIDNLSPDNPYSQKVADEFATEHGDDPFLFIHGMNWDALMLVKAAVESAGSTEGTAVKEAFEKITDFPAAHGQTGYTLSWTSENHNGSSVKGHVVVRFEDGQPKVWDEFQP